MSPTTIASLPPEILTLIFEDVHAEQIIDLDLQPFDSQSSRCKEPNGSDENNINLKKLSLAVKKPSFFPYSLTAVCPYWEDVLSSIPRFWTIVVVALIEGSFAIEKSRKHFSWSRNLPIDVLMIRDQPGSTPELFCNIWEDYPIHGCMRALMPHFHRCRTLYIDATINSSLPILPNCVPCETPLLRHLIFTSGSGLLFWSEDMRKHIFSMDPSDFGDHPGGTLVEFKPRLKTLVIDGRNVQRALAQNKHWIQDLEDLEDLIIEYYSPSDLSSTTSTGGPPNLHFCDECALSLCPVLEMVESADSLVHLTFKAVAFQIASVTPNEVYDLSGLETITFEEIEPESLQEILKMCIFSNDEEFQSVIFERCPRFNRVAFPPLYMASLHFYGLEAEVVLESAVRGWEGQYLTIGDCFCFSDSFLDALATPEDPDSDDVTNEGDEPATRRFLCNEMNVLNLYFSDSAPYSIAALRKLVEARGSTVDYADENWRDDSEWGPPLHTIRLSGMVPEISEEDQAWFQSRLVGFLHGEWWKG